MCFWLTFIFFNRTNFFPISSRCFPTTSEPQFVIAHKLLKSFSGGNNWSFKNHTCRSCKIFIQFHWSRVLLFSSYVHHILDFCIKLSHRVNFFCKPKKSWITDLFGFFLYKNWHLNASEPACLKLVFSYFKHFYTQFCY